MLKILVCIKQVPDVDQMKLDPETGSLIRTGVSMLLNPADANTISAALSIKEEYGAEITAITMGPPSAEEVLREALAVGVDHAILVTDRAFGGADTLATSYTIVSAANTVDSYDLIFCSKESIDGATGQMGVQVAERYHSAQATGVLKILDVKEEDKIVKLEREVEEGREILNVELPCVLTMEKENYAPRIPKLKGKMAAKKAPITTVTLADIADINKDMIGDAGSPTKTAKTYVPDMPEPGIILNEGSLAGDVEKVLAFINE